MGKYSRPKKTLKKFNWKDNPQFIENSTEWLKWTKETVYIISYSAAFSEELMHTIEVWVNAGAQSYKREKALYGKDDDIPKRAALGAHFAVNNFSDIGHPYREIHPNIQLDFLETLQHERVHVFRRYWNVLKWDIPYASALGITAAQIQAEFFQVHYKLWDKAYNDEYNWRELIKGAYNNREFDFLVSIENLQNKYRSQIEDEQSYADGYYLAVACSVYFNSVEKARIFIELLAYGIEIKEAHDIAYEGRGKKNINNQYEVFDIDTYRLKMSGFWNPLNNGSIGCCAWESIMRGGFQIYKNVLKRWNIEDSNLHNLLCLRSGDQAEASHFTHSGFRQSQFIYYSLPCATYSVKPFLSDNALKLINEIQTGCYFNEIASKFQDALKKHGIYDNNLMMQEFISPSINTPELQRLRATLNSAFPNYEAMQSKIKKLTKQWAENPTSFQDFINKNDL
ncbi:MAG: hypothetical protein CSA29_04730 [Desulfobacterales bacterium]|nr:MAG: hypothetical protein CSA29_04730 [Desulfobacterales bacterium]